MSTLRIGRHEFGIELWCPATDLQNWQLATAHRGGRFNTHEWWLGPLHIVRCTPS